MITVYTKRHCVQCTATVRWLDEHHVAYTPLPAADHLDYLLSLGYKAAPVVVTDSAHWYGFNPDLLETLLEGNN